MKCINQSQHYKKEPCKQILHSSSCYVNKGLIDFVIKHFQNQLIECGFIHYKLRILLALYYFTFHNLKVEVSVDICFQQAGCQVCNIGHFQVRGGIGKDFLKSLTGTEMFFLVIFNTFCENSVKYCR